MRRSQLQVLHQADALPRVPRGSGAWAAVPRDEAVDEAHPEPPDGRYAEKLAAREQGVRALAATRRRPLTFLALMLRVEVLAPYKRGAGRSAA